MKTLHASTLAESAPNNYHKAEYFTYPKMTENGWSLTILSGGKLLDHQLTWKMFGMTGVKSLQDHVCDECAQEWRPQGMPRDFKTVKNRLGLSQQKSLALTRHQQLCLQE